MRRFMIPWYSGVIFLALFLALSGSAFAARDNSTTEERDQLVSQSETFRKLTQPLTFPEESKPTVEIEEKEPEKAPETDPSFLVKKIEIEGNTLFPADHFDKILKPFENQKLSFTQLSKIADAITDIYKSKGFVTSRAFVPPQKIKDGIVTIRVLEGKIGQVRVEGNRYFAARVYTNAIHPRPDRIFQYDTLVSDLYLLNQEPDREVRSYISAGEKPEESDLVLKVTDHNPFHAHYEFNNRGTKLTHRARNGVSLTHNNFLGRDDVLSGSFFGAEEGALKAGSMNYSIPIPHTSTSLGLASSYTESILVKHLRPFDIRGNSWSLVPSITHAFVTGTTFSLDGTAALEIIDSKSTIAGEKSNFDRMRVFRIGPAMSWQDKNGRTSLSGDIHQGIPRLLGGSDSVDADASRADSGGLFTFYTADLSRLQALPFFSYLVLRADGQWTQDNLTSLEQYRAGGAFSVRGYPESDSAGDSGFLLSAELNTPIPFLPRQALPFSKETWYNTTRFVTFLDGAKTFSRNRAEETSEKDRFLLGTGFGIRFDLAKNISVRCDLGFPIGDDSSEGKQHPQAHVSARCGF